MKKGFDKYEEIHKGCLEAEMSLLEYAASLKSNK
jgi:hypothetical protein